MKNTGTLCSASRATEGFGALSALAAGAMTKAAAMASAAHALFTSFPNIWTPVPRPCPVASESRRPVRTITDKQCDGNGVVRRTRAEFCRVEDGATPKPASGLKPVNCKDFCCAWVGSRMAEQSRADQRLHV